MQDTILEKLILYKMATISVSKILVFYETLAIEKNIIFI